MIEIRNKFLLAMDNAYDLLAIKLMVAQGSDVWGEPEGYRDVEHKRWSRTCRKCGKVEYTTHRVSVKYEPVF